MQPKQDTLMPGEDDDASKNFGPHEDEKSILKEQEMEGDHRDLVGKNLDTRSRARDGLLGHTPQAGLLASESLSSLREVRFSEQEFPAGKLISDIKYYHPGSQNDNPFYLFNDQLDYALANYFAESETTKSNIDRFLSDPLMALLSEKLSYLNAAKGIEKLLDIPWSIPNDKGIDYKFELQNSVGGMAGQEISIHLQNVIGCLKFLIGHPGFWHNQTYEPSHVYNENEHRVYNEMHIGKGGWKEQKKHPSQATIISILILSNKTVMSLSHGDQTLWLVYITIGNLNAKTWRSQKRPGTLLLGFIPIFHKRLEDSNNKDKNVKAKIYHMALKTMLQRTYPSLPSVKLRKRDTNDIAALLEYKDGIELMCANSYKRRCYLVLAGLMVDYKEQVFITGIETNRQCSICHVLPKEREFITRLWKPRTYQSTWTQLEGQCNDPAIQRNRAADAGLHKQECFAWDHKHVNIHAIFLSDILHQLYKGIVTNLVS